MTQKQHYMTRDERMKLEAYTRAKKPVAWIAQELGFSRQTIYNECGARQANSNLVIENEWLPDLSTINYLVADTQALAENQTTIQDMWREATRQ